MTRTATAKVPNELYDTLKPNEQEVWDLIGSLGFRPDKTDDGKWTGLKVYRSEPSTEAEVRDDAT